MKSTHDFLFRIPLLFALFCFSSLHAQHDLSDYEVCDGPFTVDSIPFNLSGIAFNPVNGLYYCVTNTPPTMYEIDSIGGGTRKIPLVGFQDVEGICHLFDNSFAIVEERLGRIHLVTVAPGDVAINYPPSDLYVQLAGTWLDNTGIEGLSFDEASNTLYLVEEKLEMEVYSISDPFSFIGNTVAPDIPFNLQNSLDEIGDTLITDMSGILAMDSCLFLLSDEGKKIIQLDAFTGVQKDTLFDLSMMSQPEGICLGAGDNIYIVGEANEMLKLCLDSMALDTMMMDTMNMDTMMMDTMNMDTMNMDTMMMDTMGMDTMNMDTTTLVFQPSILESLIYPNPAKEYIFINTTYCTESVAEIYDIKGQKILSQTVGSEGIRIADYPPGIYMIVFQCGEIIWSSKFVKSP